MPITGGVGIRELAARLMGIDAELRAELTPAVLEAGNIVGDQAKQNAGFSSKIPSQISVSAKFGASAGGAQVRVGPGVYPHVEEARVMESGGTPREFRHPVYGNENAWASQESHPFLHPALDEKRPEAVEVIAAAVHQAFHI